MKTCRTCHYLNVPLNAAGERKPRQSCAYRCNAPVAQRILPASCEEREVSRSYMFPNSGDGCAYHVPVRL